MISKWEELLERISWYTLNTWATALFAFAVREFCTWTSPKKYLPSQCLICVAPRIVMWLDVTWCVNFESLWWSSKLIRCQRMRLHPKHEDKPCASTEDFSKHVGCIETLESLVATCTCVPYFPSLRCMVDVVVISMHTCVWFENAMMISRYPTPFLWDLLKRSVLHPSSLW